MVVEALDDEQPSSALPDQGVHELFTLSTDLAHLVPFEAGMHFPLHSHPGPETLLVLEGSYTDSLGQRVCAGDVQHMAAGTQHSFLVAIDSVCVAASLQHGMQTPWLW